MTTNSLMDITQAVPLERLSEVQLEELQIALGRLGLYYGEQDGVIGPKLLAAWAEFKADIFQGNVDLIGSDSVALLHKKLDEVEAIKTYDFSTKEGTIEAIQWGCKILGLSLKTQIAYVLAVVEWETAQTFKPTKEAFWMGEDWRKTHLPYYPYYGRGFILLTNEPNYRKYSQLLKVDLIQTPDLALNEENAVFILIHGLKTGAFTGRKLTTYINDNQTDFVNAFRSTGGVDRAHEKASIAEKYLKTL